MGWLVRNHAGRLTRSFGCGRALVLLASISIVVGASVCQAQSSRRSLSLHGAIQIPGEARNPSHNISVMLFAIGTSFTAQTLADTSGAFRFDKLPASTYRVLVYIPGVGEVSRTVDITPSFADSNGTVEKTFSFDDDALHHARPGDTGGVSVRELSIPSSARREFQKAIELLRKPDPEEAARHLEKAVSLAPQFVEAYNHLGILRFQKGNYAAAEDYFRRALQAAPDAYEPLVNLGGTLILLNRLTEAIDVNQRAHEARPYDALASAQLGMCYFLTGADEDALDYLLLTEQLDPAHYTDPQLPLAKIYLRRSNPEAALEELSEFLKYHPDSEQAPAVQDLTSQIEKVLQTHPVEVQ